ncbi:MAG: NUDIX hydrolase [Propionibacteriaceae bacterium]|nr:NUDIX hydrolase [Propionibacteriaceae bacterium]
MSPSGPVEGQVFVCRAELRDTPASWVVRSSTELAAGHITTYLQDDVETPDGKRVTREYLRHPGAVAVIALDAELRVALVRQYRHPVRHRLVEPPAGLLDVDGEDYLIGAKRELAEEVGLAAGDWRVLVDLFSSPGMASESMRIYLARDLTSADAPDGFLFEGEEAEMDAVWAPLDDLVDAVLAGDVHNPNLVSGVLAASAAQHRGGFDTLRPADAAWPARDASISPSQGAV